MTAIWLRWSWRDLRARWVQVAAIAIIIALGVGTYAGLTSTAAWRRDSYDASYRRLAMYDLRATTSTGTFVDAAALRAAGRSLLASGVARAAAVQFESPVQVDASGRSAVFVPGRLVGVEPVRGGPAVNRLGITVGRGLRATDAGRPVVVLDEHFASRRGIHPGATIRLSGDRPVRVVGRALAPEHFIVLGEQGSFLSDADYAIVYAPITTASALLGRRDAANVLVVRTAPGVPLPRARRALVAALERAAPGTAMTVNDRAHDRGHRLLYRDIEGDQRLYDIFALLILLGAAFAAFNLTARIVEAQRREIGIGMALGVPGAELAVRPLLIGAQIALLGAAFGALVGLALGALMIGVLRSLAPLPVWRHTFQVGVFLRAAALGIAIPFVATLLPVWRAVRVMPVDAIRTGARAGPHRARAVFAHRTTRRSGASLRVLPFRNVIRAPRRTVLTAAGIAAAIAVLIGVIGMVDSFSATVDRAEQELVTRSPRRMTVSLSSFDPVEAAPVVAARTSPLVSRSATQLQLPARARHGSTSIDLLVIVGDLDGEIWRPTVDDRRRGPGIVLTHKAIDDLGLAVGDRVSVRYPRREGLGYRFVTRRLRIVGASPFPLRSLAWMDDDDGLARTNLAGVTNVVIVEPRPGVPTTRVARTLFRVPGVASVQPVTQYADTIRKELDRALGILVVVEVVVLLLALLIAFNTASINADDRAREHATMFAFGLPARAVMTTEVVESLLVGLLGTALGVLGGWLLLRWLVTSLLPGTVPDLGIVTDVATRTLVLAVLMGVIAVAAAPVLTARKLLRMDIPSTLRVVE